LPEQTNGYVFGNYEYIDKAKPVADQGRINEIDLLANDPDTATELAQRIDRAFANSATPLRSITDKMARSGSDFNGLDIKKITHGIALAGMFMVLFLTANGIAQSVRERFSEFATLKTIGFSDRAVTAMVTLESALPCVIGAALGVGIAAVLARQIPKLMPPGFGLPLPSISLMVILWAAAAAFTVAMLSAVLPILRLKQMDIATALSGRG
jgi:putative ABC transport system permease protein